MDIKNASLLDGNKIELHYWFNDNSHTMNAIIQNKCEYEFLGIIKEIASKFEAEVIIETEPLAEGGLKRYFKIVSKSEKKSAIITTAVITALVTGIIVTPITTSISKFTEKIIERIFEDKELKELQKDNLKKDIELKDLEKEKIKFEIEKLKKETNENIGVIDKNNVVKKRRSNFYETLESYSKLEKISIVIENSQNVPISEEFAISKNKFKDFILVSDDLEPLDIDDAIIEIISPVLKKGRYKWMGIYNGEPISFNVKSNEFKTLVQTGKIEFKNGSSINCQLEIRKKIDSEGNEKIVGYDVIRVNHYFENEKPIETPEGKRYRQQKEADERQIKLWEK